MPGDSDHERGARDREAREPKKGDQAEYLSYLCDKLDKDEAEQRERLRCNAACNPLQRLMQTRSMTRGAKRRRDDSGEGVARVERERNDARWRSLVESMMDQRLLSIPTEVIASAILYMHRYFELEPSVTENEWVLPVTSLWLACKVAGDGQFPAYGARTMERRYAVYDVPGAKHAGARNGAAIRALEILMLEKFNYDVTSYAVTSYDVLWALPAAYTECIDRDRVNNILLAQCHGYTLLECGARERAIAALTCAFCLEGDMVTNVKLFMAHLATVCAHLAIKCDTRINQPFPRGVDTDHVEYIVNMCVHCSKECAVPLRKTLRCIMKTYTRVDVWRLYDGYTSDSDKAAEVTPHGAKWQEPCTTNVKAVA